jgi:hypothetical protein
MADAKVAYGSSTAITATGLASLAEGAAYALAAVDNTSDKFFDVIVNAVVKLQTGTPASEKSVYVLGYFSEDGTQYTDNATGSAGSITLRVPTNLVYLTTIACPDSGGLSYDKTFTVAAASGGWLPRKWGLVFVNRTNITFSATGSDHVVTYTGRYETIT